MTPNTTFTIVTYTPDPITAERVNIGVIVLSDTIHCRFIQNWARVKSFGSEPSLQTIRQVADYIELLCLNTKPLAQLSFSDIVSPQRTPQDTIRKMVGTWSHHVQFSPLRPSLEEPSSLLERLSARYLVERGRKRRIGLTKSMVTSDVVKAIRSTIDQHTTDRKFDARSRVPVSGELIKNLELDFGVRSNDHVLAGGHSVSFQILDERDIHSTWMEGIYMLQDIKREHPDRPLGLAIAPPFPGRRDARTREYDQAASAAKSAKIDLLHPDEYKDWASEALYGGVAAD